MKRHPALAPLSRDHHHALVLAQRLRRAGEPDATDAAAAFLEPGGASRAPRAPAGPFDAPQ